jgi:DNA-binding MarR family transcriptional regulator
LVRRERELAKSLRLSVARLARKLRQQDRNGLGPTLTSALASINRNGGLTHGELATVEQLSPPTITAIVGKMDALGLITREIDDRDRRVTRISITAAGRAELTDVRNRRTEWLERQLQALSDADLAALDAAAAVLATLAESPDVAADEPVGAAS